MSPSLQQAHPHPPEGSPFQRPNSTSVRATSDYDDNEIEEFYDQQQNFIDQTPKKDILVVQRDYGMQKWARMLVETGKAFVDLSAMTTQMREDSDFCSLLPL